MLGLKDGAVSVGAALRLKNIFHLSILRYNVCIQAIYMHIYMLRNFPLLLYLLAITQFIPLFPSV